MYCQKKNKRSNMFSVKRGLHRPLEPEPVEGGEYEDDDDEPVVQIVKPKRVKNRLPGENLLRQLHRDRQRARIDEKLSAMVAKG
jgi:hypothetical protein